MGQRWLAGLAWKEERRATADEHREISALTKKLQTAKLVGLPVTLLVLVFGLVLVSTGTEDGVLLGLCGLFATIPVALWWLEGYRYHASLLRDLPEPVIDIFVTDEAAPPESLDKGLGPAGRLEVLRASNTIWKCDGVRVSPLRTARLDETSNVPDHSAIVAGWMKDQDRYPDEPTYRDLTDQELAEIRRAANGVVRTALFIGVLGLYLAAVLVRVAAGFLIGQYTAYLVCVALIGLALSAFLSRYIRLAVRLFEDANYGVAAVAASEEPIESLKVAQSDIIEVLPYSGLLWIVEAKPAEWRRRS